MNSQLKDDFEEFLKTCPQERKNQYIIQEGKIFLPVYKHVHGQLSCLFEEYMRRKLNKNSMSLTERAAFFVMLYPKFPQSISLYKNGM